MMGAAAVGIAPANGGPTTGHQAAAQVLIAGRLSLETEGGDSADPAHQKPRRKTNVRALNLQLQDSRGVLPDSPATPPLKPRPGFPYCWPALMQV
ncbi:hypothetical protein HispidOSU_029934 [Sigmodon hispidus]